MLITIQEVTHEQYKRKGNDLIYQHTISLYDALCAKSFEIETLDQRLIMIPLDEIVTPATKKLVAGEGMPIHRGDPAALIQEYRGKGKDKGDLWIMFDIVFPKELDDKSKKALNELFKPSQ